MKKKCSKCGNLKPLSEFSFVHPAKMDGKLRPDCKACVRERSSKWYAADPIAHQKRMAKIRTASIKRAKELVAQYLSTHPCVDCGESDSVVLDFDHVRGHKISNVSHMVGRGYREWRLKAEIAKCEVRCANCHRRITAKRR